MLTADDSAFAGLIHRRLRHLIFSGSACNAAVPPDCAALLRRLYFPRLQQLTVEGCTYFDFVVTRE
jgi:hypothetical protein